MEEVILSCWFDGWNQRDWNAVQSIYADDALVHGRDGPLRGGQAVVELAKKWVRAIPDFQITPLHISTEEDVIVAHWRVEGVFKEPIRDIDPTRKRVAFHGFTCFRCSNRQVVEHWASVDYRSLVSKESSMLSSL